MKEQKRYVEVFKTFDEEGECWLPKENNGYWVDDETLTATEIIQQIPDLYNEILKTLAQGYCHKDTENTIVDSRLCFRQADAILTLLKGWE